MPHTRPTHARQGNLLPNPDFSDASPADPRTPAGWVIEASAPSTLVRTGRAPRQGRWALDARLAFGNEGAGAVQLICERPVRVTPGARLDVGGSFLREPEAGPPDASDPGASVWIAGQWLDARRPGRAVGQFMRLPAEPLPLGDFETRTETVIVPSDADALALVFVLVGGDANTGRVAPLVIESVFAAHADRLTQPAAQRLSADHAPGRHRGRLPADPGSPWLLTRPT